MAANKCKYCATAAHGTICYGCSKKLELIMKIQAMVRNAKEEAERTEHNESEN